MKERPIIFSGAMVRAILDGRKTQTRRVVKPTKDRNGFGGDLAPCEIAGDVNSGDYSLCPYGQPGDRLWVRESITYWESPGYTLPKRVSRKRIVPAEVIDNEPMPMEDFLVYRADGQRRSLSEWDYPHEVYDHCVGRFGKTISPIHMPRWASRIALEVTAVRVERLQDITEVGAIVEGVAFHSEEYGYCGYGEHAGMGPAHFTAKQSFQSLWESINGPGSWEANPWVWVIEFRRILDNGEG